jgi:HEAT repeat protein
MAIFNSRNRAALRGCVTSALTCLFCLSVSLSTTGCDDPKKPETWIKKLRDPKHGAEAIRQLKKLGDPKAVPALCKLFEEDPKPEVLKAIIGFKDKRSIPTLIKALDFTGDAYTNATTAAAALAKFKATEAVPALIAVLKRPLPIKSRANKAKVAAIEALKKIGDKKAVPALISVADGMPEKQDFFLNKRAIIALGEIGDAEAVPVLIKSLFMASKLQGTSYPMARVALVQIGAPAIKPLIKAMQRKDKLIEQLAKDLTFHEGVIENKCAIVLGDMRARPATPALMEMLAKADLKKTKVAGVLEALGKIGDPAAVPALLKLIAKKKVNWRLKAQITAALTTIGDKRALPVLLEMSEKAMIEGGFYNLREAAAMAYGRMVGAEAPEGIKVFDRILADKELQKWKQNHATFKEARDRIMVAMQCNDDAVCYGKKVVDKKLSLAKREKAAAMLGILPNGRKALPQLVKALPIREPILRLWLLQSAKRIGKASDKALIAMLEKLIVKDSKRKTKFAGADLASEDKIALAVVLRNK